MAATTGTSGFGTLLKAGNGGSPTETFTTIAEIKSISGPQLSIEMIDATHMESPSSYREMKPSFKDGGEVTFDVNFLPANATHTALTTDFEAKTLRNFKITWPNTGATVWSFSAYVTGFQPSAAIDDMLSASVTLKISGAVTIV